MTIIIILGLITSFFVLLYLVWYRSNHENNEKLFDTVIISYLLAIVLSRVSFMISHFGDYNTNGWSIFPFYLDENQRVWFDSLPWNFFKFDDGVLFVTLPLFILISSILYLRFTKDKNISKNIVVLFSSFILVYMMLSSFSVFNYLSNELNLDYSELIKLSLILGMFVLGIVVYIYFSRKEIIRYNEISIQSIILSVFIAVCYFLIFDGNKAYDGSFMISIIFVIISIFSSILYIRQKKIEKQTITRVGAEDVNNKKPDVSARKSYGSYRISYSTIASKKSFGARFIDSIVLKYYKLIRKSGKRENTKD